jgi:hypothetical protein
MFQFSSEVGWLPRSASWQVGLQVSSPHHPRHDDEEEEEEEEEATSLGCRGKGGVDDAELSAQEGLPERETTEIQFCLGFRCMNICTVTHIRHSVRLGMEEGGGGGGRCSQPATMMVCPYKA